VESLKNTIIVEAVKMAHHRFSDKLAFMLNNPLRRCLSPPEELVSKFGVGSNDVVVDFGCRPFFFTIPLARVSSRTIGVDASSRMLEKAAAHALRTGVAVELIQSDETQIRLPDASVDMVVLVHVLHEVEARSMVLSEFLRILKPSGRLVVVEKLKGQLCWQE
jgi:ubiquinone/menaquinone biosynthesis C-methylase UbiE